MTLSLCSLFLSLTVLHLDVLVDFYFAVLILVILPPPQLGSMVSPSGGLSPPMLGGIYLAWCLYPSGVPEDKTVRFLHEWDQPSHVYRAVNSIDIGRGKHPLTQGKQQQVNDC